MPTVFLDRIAFVCPGDGKDDSEICAINADGTGRTRLTNTPARDATHPAFEAFPAWSPDGTKIAFVSGRDSNDYWNVYLMNPDGSGQTRLTGGPDNHLFPSFTPDGRSIIFSADGLWQINVDGTGLRQVTIHNGDGRPAYSPDGRQIALTRSILGRLHIVVIDVDGSAVMQLTGAIADDDHPAWSPDGSRISFTRTGSDGEAQIFVLDVAAASTAPGPGAEKQLTDGPNGGAVPAWSPDGTRLAYGATIDGVANIWLMNADGSGQANLSGDLPNDWWPSWR